MRELKVGQFIAFEGMDGCGKSTQIRMLGEWLESIGVPYISTREPGGTAVGLQVREMLLHEKGEGHALSAIEELAAFQLDRAAHYAQVIIPALKQKKVVITDRTYASTYAYQVVAREVVSGRDFIHLTKIFTQEQSPDLWVFLRLTPTAAWQRVKGENRKLDRIEREGEAFMAKVAEGYERFFAVCPDRCMVVNAEKEAQEIHAEIKARLHPLLQIRT